MYHCMYCHTDGSMLDTYHSQSDLRDTNPNMFCTLTLWWPLGVVNIPGVTGNSHKALSEQLPSTCTTCSCVVLNPERFPSIELKDM